MEEIAISEIENLRKKLNQTIKLLLIETVAQFENKDFKQAAQILMKAKYFDKTLRDLRAKKNK